MANIEKIMETVRLVRLQEERVEQQRAYHEKLKSDVMRGRYGTTINKPHVHVSCYSEQAKPKSCFWSNVKYVTSLLIFTVKKIYA